MCWQELVAWYDLHPESDAIERSLAIFMVAQPQDLEAIHKFTVLLSSRLESRQVEQLEKPANLLTFQPSTVHRQQWKKAVEEYANRIEGLLNVSDLKADEWQQFGAVLEALDTAGYHELDRLAGECFYRAENYEEAVRIWENGDATQTLEYNRAKALLLGIPEGLEYLAEAGESDSIIAEWEKAGKPRTLHWLPYVAAALETKQQYQRAFVVYIWLDELVKVKECFERASQGAPPIKLITVLLQYLSRKKHWLDAIEAVEKQLPKVISSERQKAELKFDFVYEIACSELTPNDITKEQRRRYEKFIKEQVLSTSDWQQYLLMQQVGVALEKIGSLVETLEFYEQFVSHPDRSVRQFAQERWIATKKKQQDYARNHGQSDKASKSHAELLKKARSWAISYKSVPIDPPVPLKERPAAKITESAAPAAVASKPPTATKLVVKGLPSGTKVEQFETGAIGFGVRHLAIKVIRQVKQVLITDVLNGREVRVDGAECKVTIGEATVQAAGSKQLSFALSTSSYSGSLVCDDRVLWLELEVQGLSSKISIEL
jgi:tetratricopeptide (TPR) repeat protein